MADRNPKGAESCHPSFSKIIVFLMLRIWKTPTYIQTSAALIFARRPSGRHKTNKTSDKCG